MQLHLPIVVIVSLVKCPVYKSVFCDIFLMGRTVIVLLLFSDLSICHLLFQIVIVFLLFDLSFVVSDLSICRVKLYLPF